MAGGVTYGAAAGDEERCAVAALLERAYRLALWLREEERAAATSPSAFAVHVASSELVEVLDEARARLVTGGGSAKTFSSAGTPTPARSSAPPDR